MRKFRILYGILFLLITASIVYGSVLDDEEEQLSGLQFMKQIVQQKRTKGESLLLFSNVHIRGEHTGSLYIVNGKIKIDGEVHGNIYAYGAEVYIRENAIITGDIKTISSKTAYHQDANIKGFVGPMFNTLNIFKKQWNKALFLHYTDDIPPFILNLIKIVLQMLVSLLFLSLFRGTVLLEGFFLVRQSKEVLYRGLVIYLMGIALILIFTLSIVGFPFAILLMLIIWIFSSLGEAALAVTIGDWILDMIFKKGKKDIYIEFWVGLSLVQLIKNAPILGWVGSKFLIPLISLGMLSQVLINKLLNATYISTKDDNKYRASSYRQSELYNIITKGVKGKG
ncbi:MAG: polymer-forming cytoskeletal protein [Epulopiscium sp.]|nr:polymer-forming cytoskeletal protein [Candidatus Epulonipiscium sp.]